MNSYNTIARLTKDVELRYTPQGTAVASIGVAINTGWGEKQETIFINVVAWKKLAENANQYISKGSMVGISGRLQQRVWLNKEGQDVRVIEIVANDIKFLDPKKETAPIPEAVAPIPMEEEVIIPGEEEQMF